MENVERKNLVGALLTILGIISGVAGLVVGFVLLEVPIEGYQYLTEKRWSVFWTWVALGTMNMVLFFGLAEVIYLLDTIRRKGSGNQ